MKFIFIRINRIIFHYRVFIKFFFNAKKRGHNALLVRSFGKALVSPESRLKQKQPAPSGEDTRLAIDFHLMIPCRIYQILPNRMVVIAYGAISYVVLNCLFRKFAVLVNTANIQIYF